MGRTTTYASLPPNYECHGYEYCYYYYCYCYCYCYYYYYYHYASGLEYAGPWFGPLLMSMGTLIDFTGISCTTRWRMARSLRRMSLWTFLPACLGTMYPCDIAR